MNEVPQTVRDTFKRICDLWRSKGYVVEVLVPPHVPSGPGGTWNVSYGAYVLKNGVCYRANYWTGCERWRHSKYVRPNPLGRYPHPTVPIKRPCKIVSKRLNAGEFYEEEVRAMGYDGCLEQLEKGSVTEHGEQLYRIASTA